MVYFQDALNCGNCNKIRILMRFLTVLVCTCYYVFIKLNFLMQIKIINFRFLTNYLLEEKNSCYISIHCGFKFYVILFFSLCEMLVFFWETSFGFVTTIQNPTKGFCQFPLQNQCYNKKELFHLGVLKQNYDLQGVLNSTSEWNITTMKRKTEREGYNVCQGIAAEFKLKFFSNPPHCRRETENLKLILHGKNLGFFFIIKLT